MAVAKDAAETEDAGADESPPILDINNLEEIEMPMTDRPRGAMLCARFDHHAVRLIRRAAQLEGISQSEFVRRSAVAAAERVLQRVGVVIFVPASEMGQQDAGVSLANTAIATASVGTAVVPAGTMPFERAPR